MAFQPGANLYTIAFGNRPENLEVPHFDVRAPTTNDINYPLGKQWLWINTAVYELMSFSSGPTGTIANWALVTSINGSVTSFTPDTGGTVYPSATGNVTIAGTANQVLTTGTTNTLTISLIGPYTPSTYTAHGVLVGEGTSSIVALAVGSNGQVLLGSTGADPAFGTLTTTTGISYTTGAHALAINVQHGGFAVVDQTSGSAALAVQTMYVTDNGASLVTYTLPATATQGSVIKIVGSSVGGWTIAQNASQQIKQGASSTTAGTGGSLSSTNHNDTIELIASVGGASTIWTVANSSGTLTFV